MDDWMWAILGCCFFPTLFVLVVHCQNLISSKQHTTAVIYAISLRFVSAVQAIFASCIGVVIATSCQDVLRDRHWLTEPYAWFMTPYFYYDLVAMYLAYWHKTHRVQVMTTTEAVVQFVKDTPLLVFHHVCFPLVCLPVVVSLRKGEGDYFVGCFYLIELAVPFISLRAVLIQLHKENTVAYVLNGAALFVTFSLCRVAIFPYLYWVYGRHIGVPTCHVPFHIPVKCTTGCAGVLMVQLYWWVQIARTSAQTVRKLSPKWCNVYDVSSVGKEKIS